MALKNTQKAYLLINISELDENKSIDDDKYPFGLYYGDHTKTRAENITGQWFKEEGDRNDFIETLKRDGFVHVSDVKNAKEEIKKQTLKTGI